MNNSSLTIQENSDTLHQSDKIERRQYLTSVLAHRAKTDRNRNIIMKYTGPAFFQLLLQEDEDLEVKTHAAFDKL